MEKVLNNDSIKVVFDNIAFSLQNSGGVTGVWKELISRFLKYKDFSCTFVEYKNAQKNINRREVIIPSNLLLQVKKSPILFERYLNPRLQNNQSKFIFHSSYYRTSRNKNAINITTVHDFIHEKFRSGIPMYINHIQKKYALMNSDAIICVSESTKNDLKFYFPNIDQDKIHVIYNGVDSDVFKKLSIDKPHTIYNLGNYILYVGNRKQKYKNFESLVGALQFHTELNLVLVGGGPPSKNELQILNNKLSKRIIYLENVDNQKLNILYNFAFALVYPSVYEGFGMPIIEAQSAGCPVIATKCPSVTEITNQSAILTNTGSIVELTESIELLKNNDQREAYIKKGLINSKSFSWNIMAEKVSGIYKALFNI